MCAHILHILQLILKCSTKSKCSKTISIICRCSRRRCFVRKGILRNFAKFTGKHLCQSLFFNQTAGLRPATLLKKRLWPATLLKKRLWHRCFPVNFIKFLRTPFLQNTSGRLLLIWVASSSFKK